MVPFFARKHETLLSNGVEDEYFCSHANNNLLHVDEKEHLTVPDPMFSCVIPTMGI